MVKEQLEPKERSWGGGVLEHAPSGRFLKFGPLKMHFCIQVADVDLDVAVLPDATATSGVSDVDASPNHMNELSPIK